MESVATTKDDVRCFAGSVGVLIDRTSSRNEVLASVWLIDENTVATCAHAVSLFADVLPALKVVFPATGEERGVKRAMFHPRFNRKMTLQFEDSLSDYVPVLQLQKHNAAVLELSESVPELRHDIIYQVNQKLTMPAPPREQGLGGNLSEIDLALVIQTITNGRKEGVLIISDDRNRTIARIFCQDGKVKFAKYANLHNEMAIYQIVNQKLEGNFYFTSRREPDWEHDLAIARPTDMLLIESHRRLDELGRLHSVAGSKDRVWTKNSKTLNIDVIPVDIRTNTKMLWAVIDGCTPSDQLWRLTLMDDYAIFQALAELIKTNQVNDRNPAKDRVDIKKGPFPLASQMPLAPWDEICNLTVDLKSGLPRVKTGCLLGTLRPQDPYHLIHNLPLPPEAAGSPLLKDGIVIGMHCGRLPSDPQAQDPEMSSMQQMIWVDAILECLNASGEQKAVKKLTLSGEDSLSKIDVTSMRSQAPGCREVARVYCSRCGSTSLDSSRFCKTCGQRLLQDTEYRPRAKSVVLPYLVLALCLILGMMAAGFIVSSIPQANIANGQYATIPDAPWATAQVIRFDQSTGMKAAVPPNTTFKKGDLVYLQIDVKEPSYVYLLLQSTTQEKASLVSPDSQAADLQMHPNSQLFWPRTEDPVTHELKVTPCAIGGPSGADTFIIIASHNQSVLASAPEKAEAVFQKAQLFLDQDENFNGLEVDSKWLGEGIFSKAPGIGESERHTVYLRRLKILH